MEISREKINIELARKKKTFTQEEVNAIIQERLAKETAMRMTQVGSLDSSLKEEKDGHTVGDMVPGDVDVEASVLDDMESRQLSEASRINTGFFKL